MYFSYYPFRRATQVALIYIVFFGLSDALQIILEKYIFSDQSFYLFFYLLLTKLVPAIRQFVFFLGTIARLGLGTIRRVQNLNHFSI